MYFPYLVMHTDICHGFQKCFIIWLVYTGNVSVVYYEQLRLHDIDLFSTILKKKIPLSLNLYWPTLKTILKVQQSWTQPVFVRSNKMLSHKSYYRHSNYKGNNKITELRLCDVCHHKRKHVLKIAFVFTAWYNEHTT